MGKNIKNEESNKTHLSLATASRLSEPPCWNTLPPAAPVSHILNALEEGGVLVSIIVFVQQS